MKDKNINLKSELKIYNNEIVFDGSEMSYSLSVFAHRQNSRQGTLGCKDRSSLISRSNKKPWKQKGTGRARAGTARSPIWRGGAVSHPPQMRIKILSVNKKVNKSAMKYVLRYKISNNMVYSLDWMPNKSCSDAYSILKKNNFNEKKIILIHHNYDYESIYSFSNLKNVCLVAYDSIHPYVIGSNSAIIFLEKDRNIFESMVNSWIN